MEGLEGHLLSIVRGLPLANHALRRLGAKSLRYSLQGITIRDSSLYESDSLSILFEQSPNPPSSST
jgi:hypothetical protein